MENGYHMWDFKGNSLREDHIERFKQFAWRPRPPTMLSKEQQKQIRKNLREYSKLFEQEDAERGASADLAVVEARRRLLSEWLEWRKSVEEEVEDERLARGLPKNPIDGLVKLPEEGEEQIIEEIVEEVLEEHEEIVP